MEETKYRRVDIEGGYIYDKDDIDYYRATQKIDVIDNYMLGDFNMVGTYVINNSINEELSKIRKYYKDTYERTILCESYRKFMDRPLQFALRIIPNYPKMGQTLASLELLEEIKKGNGFYKNTNTSLVESKIFEGKNVEDKIFKYFNIQKDPDGAAVKQESDFDVRHINERLDIILKTQKMASGLMTKYDKELYDKRISALLKNKKATIILEEFNKRVFHAKDNFLDRNSRYYYRHLNNILDSVLETFGSEIVGEKSLLKALREAQQKYASEMEKIDAVVTSKLQIEKDSANKLPNIKREAKEEPKKEDKQEEKKQEKKEEKKEEKAPEVKSEKTSGSKQESKAETKKSELKEEKKPEAKLEKKPKEDKKQKQKDDKKAKLEEEIALADALNDANKEMERQEMNEALKEVMVEEVLGQLK